jgi:DoxX-like family
MTSDDASSSSRLTTVLGATLSTLVVIVLAADAVVQFLAPAGLRAEMEAVGFSAELAPVLAAITAVCALVYAIPRTALLGAILITGFLGGAICTHLRIGEYGSPPQLISLALGVMTWGGLYLRNPQLRALFRSARKGDRARPQPAQ